VQAFDHYRIERLSAPPLILEPLIEQHAAILFPLFQDPALYTFVPEDPPQSLELLQARFRTLEGRRSPERDELWLNWVVMLDGNPAGLVQATCRSDRKLFVAYEVFDGFRRRGVAVGAVSLMLSHLSRLHLADLALAYVDTRNAASIAVLARLGFSRVRKIDGADYFKNAVSDEYEFLRTMTLPPAS